ncbi:aminotransferase class I/II-fold pyridoxal phosphate-dependent enzyme [Streptomyces xanthophaeus]
MCDLGPGYLDPAVIPLDELAKGFSDALSRYGADALSYGHSQGPLPFREAMASAIARREDVDCAPGQLLVTAGTSHTLDLLAAATAQPGDVVLVEELSYDLGRRIFEDRGLVVREVARDGSGICPAALDEAVGQARAAGRTVAFAYLIPTFHNPTGTCMPEGRRRDVVEVARRRGLLVLEDDAYADVRLDPSARPRSLAARTSFDGIWQLGSFSKSLAPGLRLGWLVADAQTASRLAARGAFASGGCPSHICALTVSTLLSSGFYERHLPVLQDRLRRRRDALAGTLQELLPGDFTVAVPEGGLFVWVELPEGLDDGRIAAASGRAGVPVAPGSRFGSAHGRPHGIRLSFAAHPPDRLQAAARKLAAAWTEAPAE